MGAVAALNAKEPPTWKKRLEDVTEKEEGEMYKLQRRAEEEELDGSYRLLECRVRLVWRSEELALPIGLLVLLLKWMRD